MGIPSGHCPGMTCNLPDLGDWGTGRAGGGASLRGSHFSFSPLEGTLTSPLDWVQEKQTF